MSDMKTYFLKFRGLNPITDSDSMDFGYTVEQYIEKNKENNSQSILDSLVLQAVLFPRDIISNFN